MAIKSVCGSCGYIQPLQAGLQDARSRTAMGACLRIAPSLADRLIVYLELFSPGERAIRSDRLANLLEELSNGLQAAEIERDGRVWSAPLESWLIAFDAVIAQRSKLTLPLPNHGYLYSILANNAAKYQGKQEKKKEQRAQSKSQTRPSDRNAKPKKAINTLAAQSDNASDFASQAKQALKRPLNKSQTPNPQQRGFKP